MERESGNPADSSGATAAPPLLSYADLPTRYGAIYQADAGHLSITLPGSRRWQYLLGFFLLPLLFGLYCIGGGIFGAIRGIRDYSAGGSAGELAIDLINFAIAILFGLLLLSFCRASLNRRVIIQLDDRMLTITRTNAAGRTRRIGWKRADILDIKAGPVPWTASRRRSMGLHIYVRFREIVEVLPGYDTALAEWLAATLRQALGRAAAGTGPAAARGLAGVIPPVARHSTPGSSTGGPGCHRPDR